MYFDRDVVWDSPISKINDIKKSLKIILYEDVHFKLCGLIPKVWENFLSKTP